MPIQLRTAAISLLCVVAACGSSDAPDKSDTEDPSVPGEQDPSGESAWGEWHCEAPVSDYCVAWWPRTAAGSDIEAQIECTAGEYCEFGRLGTGDGCESPAGAGCAMCEAAFRQCYLPWAN